MDDAPAPGSAPGARPVEPGRPAPSEPRVLGRVAFALAVAALVAYAAGLVLLVFPVRTPQVQDCGAPGAFLLDGRVDVVPDAEDRILDGDGEVVQLPAPVADAARERPCRERVAARAVPAVALIGGATIVGLVAFAAELFLVRPRRRRALAAQAWTGPATPEGPPAPRELHQQD